LTKIDVLDKGYVRLVDTYGDELSIVNAARVSYDQKSESLEDRDRGLLKFLVKHEHTSPMRHVFLSVEFNAPLLVARQHWRHIVGASTIEAGTPFSELSRRYVRDEPEFYIPEVWRSAPENSKQGSGAGIKSEYSSHLREQLQRHVLSSIEKYESAMELGVAPEQARLFLPAYAMYTRYLWTPSLHAALNFVALRSAQDSQVEIREYSLAVERLIEEKFPTVYEEFIRGM